MDWNLVKNVGKVVYKLEDWKDYKRYYVFLIRCYLNQKTLAKHLDFFEATALREKILLATPFFLDQATRQVFYKDSQTGERATFIQKHILLMEYLFKDNLLSELYVKCNRVLLWQDEFEGKPLCLYLVFRDGQQKEGCLSIELVYDSLDLENTGWDAGIHVYQIMFTLAHSKEDGQLEIVIGALQGLNNGAELIKKLTKAYFGYRTKNLIMWCMRCIAEFVEAKHLLAVSNKGYYAMNHYRMDRKLKVDLDVFWRECEGQLTEDYRFFKLPIEEYRKSMEELKPSKRAQHRRRFEKMDEIKASIEDSLGRYRK